MKFFFSILFALIFSLNISANPFLPNEIKEFMSFYPDVKYTADYDISVFDWKIEMKADLFFDRTAKPAGEKSAVFYWADGRLLPKEELSNKDNYWVLRYKYTNTLRDPKTYTEEEIEQMKTFGSSESRKNMGGTPMFFFDWLYSAQSKIIIEEHIIRTTFLGKPTRIHERIWTPLKNVEKKIKESLLNPEVKAFLDSLKSADAYHWREIAETSRKSFHSYGIAVDVLPKKLAGRAIYWGWEKERSGDKWMLVPLEKRWMPPESVIKIFESEGFIWGGYWAIFDNMHFEYHPELIGK
ncbi:M15 family metallopeptidase [Treponema sp.]|uniref:M15 family metallopeptidase n=1 Tax=Treponema sp. TaxID=166 RepID=UPI00388F660C